MAARKIVRRSCLGARPRYNLVVDEDVKKPNKQTNKPNSGERCGQSGDRIHDLLMRSRVLPTELLCPANRNDDDDEDVGGDSDEGDGGGDYDGNDNEGR